MEYIPVRVRYGLFIGVGVCNGSQTQIIIDRMNMKLWRSFQCSQ
uniref:Uncharacterized protein n=1 Tax=Arundo donax TaxID=35708 RepID=A0A0A9EEK6_ARUDO